ncbi:hypothetical protein C6370_18440 [Bacillus atrophaeus]|uniref:hypothetical protein n=1 Tax=Bacillus atrophaeus TaxID=1452 RepID=UPI000D06870A|nr:hypothetical protein [Bacillus atrophaeus]MEC0765714.1 hypothetical protein [Bacillus atrophaeus]MEC0781519.1 hypothetical protein [Bacillus atrophaeus]MEC0810168.1 hypothetical protein [Bacillus atrophaeus]MEC0935443.1 hypothetical protein [Bacillus atrophaeus]PSA91510.1 hypothetical protein C6370_18440 [Bacillus atrophaeus]
MNEKIERLKSLTYIPQKEIGWLIEQAELAVKQKAIIEENKLQQDITVKQFRQAQQDIRRLSGESSRYKKVLQQTIKNLQFVITTAKNELEGENS